MLGNVFCWKPTTAMVPLFRSLYRSSFVTLFFFNIEDSQWHGCYRLHVLLACRNGDVGFFAEDTPKIFWEGEFIGICGDALWNSHYGASIFCKKLGYQTGVIKTSLGQGTSTMQSLYIGTCAVNDTDLSTCTGGFNYYTVGEHRKCTTGKTYELQCSGGEFPKSVSCKGKEENTFMRGSP